VNDILARWLCVAGVLIGLGMAAIGLPGTFLLVVVAGLYGYATAFQSLSPYFLAMLLILSLIAEVADNLIGAAWAKRWGSSFRGIVGSMLGAIIGAAVGSAIAPIVGTIVGGLIGSFAGAFAFEYHRMRDHHGAARAGWGAFAGRVVGILLKLAICVVMGALLLWKVFTGPQ
jgi:uncharacterized protein